MVVPDLVHSALGFCMLLQQTSFHLDGLSSNWPALQCLAVAKMARWDGPTMEALVRLLQPRIDEALL